MINLLYYLPIRLQCLVLEPTATCKNLWPVSGPGINSNALRSVIATHYVGSDMELKRTSFNQCQ